MEETAVNTALDVAPLVAQIEGHLPAIALIGTTVLTVVVAIKAIKWVRGSM